MLTPRQKFSCNQGQGQRGGQGCHRPPQKSDLVTPDYSCKRFAIFTVYYYLFLTWIKNCSYYFSILYIKQCICIWNSLHSTITLLYINI